MTRFRDTERETLPPPKACETIGKGERERPLVYTSDTSRKLRRAHGRYSQFRQRTPGVGIPHEHQPWHTEDAHKEAV